MMEPLRRLAGIDLNLLVVFRALDETRHVTEASRRLGLSQPALSHSLNRLRALFGDRLFVKTPSGMVPTARARELSAPVRELLDGLHERVLRQDDFDPRRLQRTFRIRTTDWLEAQLAPRLLRAMETAPGVKLSFQSAGFALPRTELEEGSCDLAIAGFFGNPPAGFYQQKLCVDEFACAVRKGHPLRKLTLDAFCRERHILIAPGGELSGRVDRELARHKRRRQVVLGISSFMSSLWVVAGSDGIMTAPARLLDQFADSVGLRVLPPPLPIPPITIVQVWHERNHRDPAHRWLREAALASTVVKS